MLMLFLSTLGIKLYVIDYNNFWLLFIDNGIIRLYDYYYYFAK